MAAKPLPEQGILRQLLDCDPEKGKLYWRARTPEQFADADCPRCTCARWNARYAGQETFADINNNGYRRGIVEGQSCLGHRVVWKWVYGTEPEQIDHINRDRADNRITNLRSVSRSVNMRNISLRSDNKSGHHGVRFIGGPNERWEVTISKTGGGERRLGRFSSFEEAVAARRKAEAEHGYRSLEESSNARQDNQNAF